jgi:Ser/Thr protein kinase RdoA (MazF antagonist)
VDAAEVAERFGLGAPVRLSDGPVARGRQGTVWRLETSDGRWALKALLEPVSEEDARACAELQEAAHALGVPTPGIRRTTEGRVFAALPHGQVRVYDWVDLLSPDPMLDPDQVGAAVALAHQASLLATGPVTAWYAAPVGAVRWDGLLARLRAAGAPFAGRLAALRDELVALESWVEAPTGLRTCHRDLWADNVLPTADGGICIVDWENSGPADPSHELACVLFEFARGDVGRARALTGAYRAAGGPGAVTRRGHFSMLIAQLGHITEIAAEDWLTPNPRTPERTDAEAWVCEVLDDPHSRDVLDALLEAVSPAP